MGTPLFDNNFISSVTLGATDDEVDAKFAEALEAGRQEMLDLVRESIRHHPSYVASVDDFDLAWSGKDLVVKAPAGLAEEVMRYELGEGETPPSPMLRNGLVRGAVPTAVVIDRKLDMT